MTVVHIKTNTQNDNGHIQQSIMLSLTFNAILVALLWQTYSADSQQCTTFNQLYCYATDTPFYRNDFARSQSGRVYPSLMNSKTVGKNGPIVFDDTQLINKLQTSNRENIPERIGHSKGAGAFGYFQVTHDISRYTRAAFLQPGVKSDVVVRFSTQIGEKGSADTMVDAKGFAVKFKTKDGNFDLVGLNLMVFGTRDPMKLPDLTHTRKKNPVTHSLDTNMFWDACAFLPETMLFVLMFFSQTAYPKSYRYIDGHAIHTFRLVNMKFEPIFAKFTLTSDQQNKTYFNSTLSALITAGLYPEYLTQDLYDSIAKQQYPSWTLNIQTMTEREAKHFKYNILDSTKYWNTTQFPLKPVGKLVLNKNPTNFFTDVEQAAFSPANLVPGIEATPDRLFQGRLFAYSDAQMYRLGVNRNLLPVNACPFAKNYERDGSMNYGPNGLDAPNYYPNSFNGPTENHSPYNDEYPYVVEVDGNKNRVDRYDTRYEDNFSQCQEYVNSLSPAELKSLFANMAFSFINVSPALVQRCVQKLMVPISPQFAHGLLSALEELQQNQSQLQALLNI